MLRAIAFIALATWFGTSAAAQYLSQMTPYARPGVQVMFVVTALKRQPPELPAVSYQVLASLRPVSLPWKIPQSAPGTEVWCWLYPDLMFWHTVNREKQTTNPPLFSWRRGPLDASRQGIFYVNVPNDQRLIGSCLWIQAVTEIGILPLPLGATNPIDMWIHP